MPIIANCVQCGSEFQKRCNQVTCSKACFDERKRVQTRAHKAASKRRPLTADDVRALFSYDPVSGLLTWKARLGDDPSTKSWNTKHANKPAGCLGKRGYVNVLIFRVTFKAHRVIWAIQTGAWPSFDVDHWDGVRSNNRWDNLRPATNALNRANSKRPSTNSTGFKGVSFYRKWGRYVASIKVNGRSYYLGGFAGPEDAHRAYVEAAKKHFGPFACAE